MRILIAAILVAVLVAPIARAAEKSIVGVWYEDLEYGGRRVISVLTIKADGTFASLHRTCLEGGAQDSTTSGRWSYENGRLRFAMPSGTVDYYETESNDGRVWVYRGVAGSGFSRYGPVRFRDIRVTAESKLPTCDTTS